MTTPLIDGKSDPVLDSIRRLVAAMPAEDATQLPDQDCLILRADQRVDVAEPVVARELARDLRKAGEPDAPDPVAQAFADLEEAVAEGRDLGFPKAQGADADDAALRALVAEAVRDELQGDLGQRITQTVRKLVRAEVNMILEARALAEQDEQKTD